MSLHLRDYQVDAIAEVNSRWQSGEQRVLLALPTGAGKTEVGVHLVQSELGAGGRALVIVDRKVLCTQWVDKMRNRGLDWVGILQGENTRGIAAPVLVATAQTIQRRGVPEGVSLVIVDESHIWHQTHDTVLATTNGAKVLGLSATPLRTGLALRFDSIVVGATIGSLIDSGYLVRPRYFAPSSNSIVEALATVSIVAGDFNQEELGRAMRGKKIIGDIVETWLRCGENRPTIVFCVDKQHARDLAAEFMVVGITAQEILDDTDDHERQRILSDFTNGSLSVLTSVGVLSVGFDAPNAACAILARPTLSLSLHIQQGGRVLRPFAGKNDALILDHACNVLKHGRLEDFEPPTSLSAIDRRTDRKPRNGAAAAWECRNCNALNPLGIDICEECGHPRRRYTSLVILEGKLTEVEHEDPDIDLGGPTLDEVQRFYSMALSHARERHRKDGWAFHATLRRFHLTADQFNALRIDQVSVVTPDQEAARWFRREEQRSAIAWRAGQAGRGRKAQGERVPPRGPRTPTNAGVPEESGSYDAKPAHGRS